MIRPADRQSVDTFLEDLSSEGLEVCYLLLSGNAGDALLNVGFFEAARRLELSYRVVTCAADVEAGETVLVSGGGGLASVWGPFVPDEIKRAASVAAQVVVLPASITGNEAFLAGLPGNVFIFARERNSYRHLLRYMGNPANVGLDHDMAFRVEANSIVSAGRPQGYFPVHDVKSAIRYGAYVSNALISSVSKHGRSLRTDLEVLVESGKRPPRYRDLSEVSNFGFSSELGCYGTTYFFLSIVNRFESMTTDRLHVGIAAYLLGRPVFLIDNSYGKLSSVAQYSMTIGENKVVFLRSGVPGDL